MNQEDYGKLEQRIRERAPRCMKMGERIGVEAVLEAMFNAVPFLYLEKHAGHIAWIWECGRPLEQQTDEVKQFLFDVLITHSPEPKNPPETWMRKE